MQLWPFRYWARRSPAQTWPVPEGLTGDQMAAELLQAMYRKGRQDEAALAHIPYVAEQDKKGPWRASAQLRPGVAAFGEGDTMSAAVDDLRSGLQLLIRERGAPDVVTVRLRDIEQKEDDQCQVDDPAG